jgi:hypothetical protein
MVVLQTSPVSEMRAKAQRSAREKAGRGPYTMRAVTSSSGAAKRARVAVSVNGPSSASASLPNGKLPAQRTVTRRRSVYARPWVILVR